MQPQALAKPAPPKSTLVRCGADFWRVFNLNPLVKEKPDG
jgi:hypothetical protein